MSFINYAAREINYKVVYYGPGCCGKSTNLKYIYKKTSPQQKGKMISLTNEEERTLFFNFLPLTVGEVDGYKVRFHLYTVPGSDVHETSRKLILKGVDAVVFVADSQKDRLEANQEALEAMKAHLQDQGYDLQNLPHVIQYNKRDLKEASSLEELRKVLNPKKAPEFEAVATEGKGVLETLKAIAKQLLLALKKTENNKKSLHS